MILQDLKRHFSVQMASLCIRKMESMEILFHLRVSNSDTELAGIAQLLKLRKLGVVLHGKNAKLNDLFHQIEKLHRRLRSLSIWINQPADSETRYEEALDTSLFHRKLLQSLNISGIVSGLPHLNQVLGQVSKVTLSDTYLKADDLSILGKLGALRGLKLRRKSYAETDLAFREGQFKSLKFLAVEGSDIISITIVPGAAPELERIVWSLPTTACLSGVDHLLKLNKFVLNGDCNPDPVKRAILLHHKCPVFRHNPCVQRQEA